MRAAIEQIGVSRGDHVLRAFDDELEDPARFHAEHDPPVGARTQLDPTLCLT